MLSVYCSFSVIFTFTEAFVFHGETKCHMKTSDSFENFAMKACHTSGNETFRDLPREISWSKKFALGRGDKIRDNVISLNWR